MENTLYLGKKYSAFFVGFFLAINIDLLISGKNGIIYTYR